MAFRLLKMTPLPPNPGGFQVRFRLVGRAWSGWQDLNLRGCVLRPAPLYLAELHPVNPRYGDRGRKRYHPLAPDLYAAWLSRSRGIGSLQLGTYRFPIAGTPGLEPGTARLTVGSSAIELRTMEQPRRGSGNLLEPLRDWISLSLHLLSEHLGNVQDSALCLVTFDFETDATTRALGDK